MARAESRAFERLKYASWKTSDAHAGEWPDAAWPTNATARPIHPAKRCKSVYAKSRPASSSVHDGWYESTTAVNAPTANGSDAPAKSDAAA